MIENPRNDLIRFVFSKEAKDDLSFNERKENQPEWN